MPGPLTEILTTAFFSLFSKVSMSCSIFFYNHFLPLLHYLTMQTNYCMTIMQKNPIKSLHYAPERICQIFKACDTILWNNLTHYFKPCNHILKCGLSHPSAAEKTEILFGQH